MSRAPTNALRSRHWLIRLFLITPFTPQVALAWEQLREADEQEFDAAESIFLATALDTVLDELYAPLRSASEDTDEQSSQLFLFN